MKSLKYIQSYSGLIAVAAVWGSIITSIFITKLDIFGETPISYLGVDPRTAHLFTAGLILAAAAFSLFALHAARLLRTSLLAPMALMAGQVAQVIVAATPYNADGINRYLHVVAAYAVAISMPLAMGLYAFTAKVKRLSTFNKWFFTAELLFFSVGLSWFILAPTAGALSEITTGIVFDLWVAALTVNLVKVSKKEHISKS